MACFSIFCRSVWVAAMIATVPIGAATEETIPLVPIGVAEVDITPTDPIRLAGYASREAETETVAQRIWAKALAIGGPKEGGTAVVVMVDSCGVPDEITTPVAATIGARLGIPREKIIIAATHTHTAPWLEGFLPYHSIDPIPADQRERLRHYSERLEGLLVEVIENAVANQEPGRLGWAEGEAGFAANRRVLKDGSWSGFGVNPDGPVDHSMPMLRATDADGKLRAVVVNYACHCTTLGGKHDFVHGDWAGCAQAAIQKAHPGVTAIVLIGCGADANPEPRETLEAAEKHGDTVASEVERLLAGKFHALEFPLVAQSKTVRLPYGELPTRETLLKDAGGSGSAAANARHFLARLDRGEALPVDLEYVITTWKFADSLAMVFLPGEVVVDYSLRLKRELSDTPLWITAYANDVPCYIPSARVIAEGGYEVDRSMESYGHPTRFAPEIEETIVEAVHSLVVP